MPLNTLALGLYELSILKRTFWHTTGFCRYQEEERRRLSIGDNFLQQLRRSGVSRVCREKLAAARTEKLGTHSHTHTHRTTAIPSLASQTHHPKRLGGGGSGLRDYAIPSLLACGGEGNKTSITTIMYYNTYQFFPYSFINIK